MKAGAARVEEAPRPFRISRAVRAGDVDGVRALLERRAELINRHDPAGYTPLLHAVTVEGGDVAMVRLLLERGADPALASARPNEKPERPLHLALHQGDPGIVAALVEAGADLDYVRDGYDALLDAVHGRDIANDPRLVPLLRWLLDREVVLDRITAYKESALRVLSNRGRFDAVGLLLAAGAPADHLQWSPLMQAVALGTANDVASGIRAGASLEVVDVWQRTAWLIAVHAGDVRKARLLGDAGCDITARGRCGKPALFYAIECRRWEMLEWLLGLGFDPEETDDFGTTALITAVEARNERAVDALLARAVGLEREYCGETALGIAGTKEIALKLLAAGADPGRFSRESRRVTLGFPALPDETFLDVSPAEFAQGREPRAGVANPELVAEPFWSAMARAGVNAYTAKRLFGAASSCSTGPVWCAHRFGQSLTVLDDGRIVQVGGEHEDSYDPDFCIYNDVFVHEPGGSLRTYAYPEDVFPPTDFHSATLVGEWIYLVGSLGYAGQRAFGETPVRRLHTRTFAIEPVKAHGDAPGWIHRHRARRLSAHEIAIEGGLVQEIGSGSEWSRPNDARFVLDIARGTWRRAA